MTTEDKGRGRQGAEPSAESREPRGAGNRRSGETETGARGEPETRGHRDVRTQMGDGVAYGNFRHLLSSA